MSASAEADDAVSQPPVRAARQAEEQNSLRVTAPVIGTVMLPAPQHLTYVCGVAALVVLGVIEWPVGLALAAGHVLAASSHNKVVQDFAHALEEA